MITVLYTSLACTVKKVYYKEGFFFMNKNLQCLIILIDLLSYKSFICKKCKETCNCDHLINDVLAQNALVPLL